MDANTPADVAPTASTAFKIPSAHPAIVFQNSCQRFAGGGSGTVAFPPFTTDVFAASLDISQANPRVWNSDVARNGNDVAFPLLFVLARSRIPHAWARVTFFVITI